MPRIPSTPAELTVPRADGTVELPGVNPVVCVRAPACLPVVGDRVVWKDRDHVTAGFLVDRRQLLWRRLVGTGHLG